MHLLKLYFNSGPIALYDECDVNKVKDSQINVYSYPAEETYL